MPTIPPLRNIRPGKPPAPPSARVPAAAAGSAIWVRADTNVLHPVAASPVYTTLAEIGLSAGSYAAFVVVFLELTHGLRTVPIGGGETTVNPRLRAAPGRDSVRARRRWELHDRDDTASERSGPGTCPAAADQGCCELRAVRVGDGHSQRDAGLSAGESCVPGAARRRVDGRRSTQASERSRRRRSASPSSGDLGRTLAGE
jgi:hypothetical protein